jgi:adenosine deaminase
LEDFANDVVYLELRTGPKALLMDHNAPEMGSCTKKQYIQTILSIMCLFEEQEHERYNQDRMSSNATQRLARLPMTPRLLVSVDRSGTVKQAEENINLAIEMTALYPDHIVGVELGGNPTRNDFRLFEPLFQKARDRGLQVSIHCGEVPCATDEFDTLDTTLKNAYEEASAILQFRPDRLGHALLLPNDLMEKLMKQPIPIECCPTSNVMTLELAMHHGGNLIDGLKRHPQLQNWIERKYPFSINTDDSGIFCTNLTKEYLLVAKVFELHENDLADMAMQTVDHIFDKSKRDTLVDLMLNRINMLKNQS